MENATTITVQSRIAAPIEKVWQYWTEPQHITQWCQASPDWHAPFAENDLQVGGRFKTTMAAKDGSFSFDFGGSYTTVEPHRILSYKIDDGRAVSVRFAQAGNETEVIETFEPEKMNPHEMQQQGWQAILDSFKHYTEQH